MDANKITLASYIAYLKGMYRRYGNISIAQLKYIALIPQHFDLTLFISS